jgi:hypothetical protein
VYFIPAAAGLLAATFAAAAVLATPTPAAAKHGESEEYGGGRDQGRHLGWYEHGGPAFPNRANPLYPGAWVGWQARGGGAGSNAWGVAWGLGPRFAYFAPPAVFVPAPGFVSLPPVVVSVPWMQAPSPYYAPVAAVPPADNWGPTPEEMLGAAVPPPAVVLPPLEVMILAGPPPLIFSPPAYALSVWPVLAFAPPMLAVAVLHDEWWSSRYRGRGGYYAGGFYARRDYAGGLNAALPVAATGFAGPHMMQRRGVAGYAVPFDGHGQDNGHGGGQEGGRHQGGGHEHEH